MSELLNAFEWIGFIDSASGQICKLDRSGKPTLILFEFGCPSCSEVGSKNAEDYGTALETIVNQAHALHDILSRIVADYRRSDEDARGVSAMEYLIEEAEKAL